MADSNAAILSEAARQARRLAAELEARRSDLTGALMKNAAGPQLSNVQSVLDSTLAAVKALLGELESRASCDDHPSEQESGA